MTRLCVASLFLFLAIATAGCCYRPGAYDPQSGLAYGGAWEPCCGGPLDPFGFWCMVQYGQCGYGAYGWNSAYGYGAGMPVQPTMYGGPAVNSPACCDPCETVAPCDGGCDVPAYTQPAYTQPAFTQPAYAEPTFAGPMTTMPGTVSAPCGEGGPCNAVPHTTGTLTPIPETYEPETVPQHSSPQQTPPKQSVPQTSTGTSATYVYPPPSHPSSSTVPGTAQQPAVQAY